MQKPKTCGLTVRNDTASADPHSLFFQLQKGVVGGLLLRCFFRASGSLSVGSAVDHHLDGKVLVVVRSLLACQDIGDLRIRFSLNDLLQDGLAVYKQLFMLRVIHNETVDEGF